MHDILMTEETLETLKTEQAALQKRLAEIDQQRTEIEQQLAEIEHVFQIVPILRKMGSAAKTGPTTGDAVLAVLQQERTRLFPVADILHGLKAMHYAPADTWPADHKYLYTVLGRLTKKGRVKKVGSRYILAGQQDANTGQETLPEVAAGETRPDAAASASVDP